MANGTPARHGTTCATSLRSGHVRAMCCFRWRCNAVTCFILLLVVEIMFAKLYKQQVYHNAMMQQVHAAAMSIQCYEGAISCSTRRQALLKNHMPYSPNNASIMRQTGSCLCGPAGEMLGGAVSRLCSTQGVLFLTLRTYTGFYHCCWSPASNCTTTSSGGRCKKQPIHRFLHQKAPQTVQLSFVSSVHSVSYSYSVHLCTSPSPRAGNGEAEQIFLCNASNRM